MYMYTHGVHKGIFPTNHTKEFHCELGMRGRGTKAFFNHFRHLEGVVSSK